MQRDAIDFENGEIGNLFRRLLFPTLLGTLSMSAMTAIDGMIVGHGAGDLGVAAVNITVPIYQIMAGLALMVGLGCSVVSSVHIAQRKAKVARLNITQGITFATLVATAMALLMAIFPQHTARLLGASPTLMEDVVSYLMPLLPGFIFEMFSIIGLFIIRLDGAPKYAMWCNIIPAVLNAILDWVFIFPCDMGVAGAGVATSICMVIGGCMALGYLCFYGRTVGLERPKFSIKSLRLSLRNIGYQCRIGFSSLLGELSLAIVVFVGNMVFMKYLGDAGVGAFGISCYYTPFFFMVGNSIAQSAQPIISYNYGIARMDRVRSTRRLLILYSTVCGAVVTSMFVFAPELLVGLFIDLECQAGIIAVDGFPYYAIGIIFFILNVAIIGYYQSIESVRRATSYVLLRGLVLLIPSFLLLPHYLGTMGIWLAMPLTELLTFVAIVITARRAKS